VGKFGGYKEEEKAWLKSGQLRNVIDTVGYFRGKEGGIKKKSEKIRLSGKGNYCGGGGGGGPRGPPGEHLDGLRRYLSGGGGITKRVSKCGKKRPKG